ncbi:MAG: hypothetical protein ACRDBO_03980 [Lachnospiraceae bacterium]
MSETEKRLPIGTKCGCLTIIEELQEYNNPESEDHIAKLEKDRENLMMGIKNPSSNIEFVEDYDYVIEKNKQFYGYNREKKDYRYKCQCQCGKIDYFSECGFLSKMRYCNDFDADKIPELYRNSSHYDKECGIRAKKREERLALYQRIKHESYYKDYLNTIHESLEVLEYIGDCEWLSSHGDRRKKADGTFEVYKLYKCRCYLCGTEQEIPSDRFSIKLDKYGSNAKRGYYSNAFCGCHEISSFQWIVTKILKENNVPYRVEYSFPDLYGKRSVNLLRYDFAVLNEAGGLKCLIECQGEQHYEPIEEFGGQSQFDFQQYNDLKKRKYAKEHNIPLYEISYKNKSFKKVESFLKSKKII